MTGGYNPTGSITFNLYGPNDTSCSKSPIYTQVVDLTGDTAATTPGFQTVAAGIYDWTASYGGDANNGAVSSGCGDEAAVIGQNSPSLDTVPSPAGGPVGSVLKDTATLHNANSPTGSITFKLYGPDDDTCSGSVIFTETVALSGTHATTTGGFTTVAAGTYDWTASWPGDANNSAASSGCGEESVVIGQNSPSLDTVPSPAGGPVGSVLKDTATLHNANSPTGSITFKLYGPDDDTCSGSVIFTETVALSGTHATTTGGFTTVAAGTYDWTASWPGDANNSAASSGCGEESVVIGQNSPTLDTTPNPARGPVGSILNDTATLHDADSPTGSITFKLYGPADTTCSKDPIYTQKVALSGTHAATTPGFTTVKAGTYEWTASYGGDANNSAASSGCGDEAVVVGKASPAITTTLSKSRAPIGTTIRDSATLTGVTTDAGGTVTYTVYSDDTCTTVAQQAGTKTVSNGLVPNSNSITFDDAGTWYWQAVYSGDDSNAGAISTCTEETLVIDPSPTPTSHATATGTIIIHGQTATPRTTPPPTNSNGPSNSDSVPLFVVLFFCFACTGLSLLAVQVQRRTMHSNH